MSNKIASSRDDVVEELKKLLANTYALYLKAQNFHWNVRGPAFFTLHKAFQDEYEALRDAVDEIAERIRALGADSPGTFPEFMELKTIPEARSGMGARAMCRQYLLDSRLLSNTAKRLQKCAEECGDQATMDLAIKRIQAHDKTAWMFKSMIERPTVKIGHNISAVNKAVTVALGGEKTASRLKSFRVGKWPKSLLAHQAGAAKAVGAVSKYPPMVSQSKKSVERYRRMLASMDKKKTASQIQKEAILGALRKGLGSTVVGKGMKNLSTEMARKKRLAKWIKANPGKEKLVQHMR